jgi:uncharacterized protein YgiM (DUF1202 family)
MKKIIKFLFIPAIIIILFSCMRSNIPDSIVLPGTSVLAAESSWGVVTGNYLRLREKPSQESGVLTGITKGTVVQIISATDRKETIEKSTSFWYRIDVEGIRGWAFGAYLEVFTSSAEAEKRAAELQ